MATTTPRGGALARRAELEQEDENLRVRLAEIAGRNTLLEREIGEVDRAIADAQVAAGRRGEPAVIADLVAERARLQAEQQTNRATAPTLQAAIEGIPGQLAMLHCNHWPEFAAEAQQLDEATVDAFNSLEREYRAAYGAWQAAASRWEQSVVHLQKGRHDQGDRVDSAQQMFGSDKPWRVPAWPLPHPDDLFAGEHRPRPPGFIAERERKAAERADVVRDLNSGSVESGASARSRAGGQLIDAYGFSRYQPLD